ncbi:hypothetical protein KFK09_016823 [Dendrobium nobile]|uniref:Uncharacterized protein n=1 Tax=Dendrobium nobile TaxID=94219 RepID=A0A8T3B150_DENNO|nr:hypothetical protein KFK09_016823 [Dendrobium nobile]
MPLIVVGHPITSIKKFHHCFSSSRNSIPPLIEALDGHFFMEETLHFKLFSPDLFSLRLDQGNPDQIIVRVSHQNRQWSFELHLNELLHHLLQPPRSLQNLPSGVENFSFTLDLNCIIQPSNASTFVVIVSKKNPPDTNLM